MEDGGIANSFAILHLRSSILASIHAPLPTPFKILYCPTRNAETYAERGLFHAIQGDTEHVQTERQGQEKGRWQDLSEDHQGQGQITLGQAHKTCLLLRQR